MTWPSASALAERRALGWGGLLAGLLLTHVPHAQTSEVLARSIFNEGQVALKAGRTDEACAKFQESRRLVPALGTLFNLATCEETRGRIATAVALYRELIEVAGPGDNRVPAARQRVAALTPRVPRLTLRTRGERLAEGEHIWLDEVKLGTASVGVALQVDPGMHELRAGAEGRERRQSFSLAEGEQSSRWLEDGEPVAVSAPVSPASAAPSASAAPLASVVFVAPLPPPTRAPAATSQLPLALMGVGAFSLTVAATAGIVALHERQTRLVHCRTRPCDTTEGIEAGTRGKRALLVGNIALVTGLVGMGSGVGLMLFTRPGGTVVALGGSW